MSETAAQCHFWGLSSCCGYGVSACDSCLEESTKYSQLHDWELHNTHGTFSMCDHSCEEDKNLKSSRWNLTRGKDEK